MVTLIAIGLLRSQSDLEAAWQEARKPCKDKGFVSYTLEAGGMGSVRKTDAILAADGRYVFSLRRELPARDAGGTGRFPMLVEENSVNLFDGTTYKEYDALTGETQTPLEPTPLQLKAAFEAFWLDRRAGGLKLLSYEDVETTVDGAGKCRIFTLAVPSAPYDWQITVRLKDGFVLAESFLPKKTDNQPLAGQQGGTLFAHGQYIDREPADLSWKPPTRRSGG